MKNTNSIVNYALALAAAFESGTPWVCYTVGRGWFTSHSGDGDISVAARRVNGRPLWNISDWGRLTNVINDLGK
jgi:hypothetical protein